MNKFRRTRRIGGRRIRGGKYTRVGGRRIRGGKRTCVGGMQRGHGISASRPRSAWTVEKKAAYIDALKAKLDKAQNNIEPEDRVRLGLLGYEIVDPDVAEQSRQRRVRQLESRLMPKNLPFALTDEKKDMKFFNLSANKRAEETNKAIVDLVHKEELSNLGPEIAEFVGTRWSGIGPRHPPFKLVPPTEKQLKELLVRPQPRQKTLQLKVTDPKLLRKLKQKKNETAKVGGRRVPYRRAGGRIKTK